ncbi:MAG TPA: J domain-containing protein [Gammaproteobacteria bacterium]|nr:J domain-containing protein [Gammaproteobacteria bacterium]
MDSHSQPRFEIEENNGIIFVEAFTSSYRRKMQVSPNYYEILGVEETSPDKKIQKAYYKLSKIIHPDKVEPALRESATQKFQKLAEAFECLNDHRELYGNALKHYRTYPSLNRPPEQEVKIYTPQPPADFKQERSPFEKAEDELKTMDRTMRFTFSDESKKWLHDACARLRKIERETDGTEDKTNNILAEYAAQHKLEAKKHIQDANSFEGKSKLVHQQDPSGRQQVFEISKLDLYKKALRSYELALLFNSEDIEALQSKAQMHFNVASLASYPGESYYEASLCYEKILRINPQAMDEQNEKNHAVIQFRAALNSSSGNIQDKIDRISDCVDILKTLRIDLRASYPEFFKEALANLNQKALSCCSSEKSTKNSENKLTLLNEALGLYNIILRIDRTDTLNVRNKMLEIEAQKEKIRIIDNIFQDIKSEIAQEKFEGTTNVPEMRKKIEEAESGKCTKEEAVIKIQEIAIKANASKKQQMLTHFGMETRKTATAQLYSKFLPDGEYGISIGRAAAKSQEISGAVLGKPLPREHKKT